MSQFLRRNRKKGLLAFLLMFFSRGKGVGPLIVMLALLSFVFIAPSGYLMNIPFVSKIAAKLGLRSALGGGEMDTRALRDILRKARERRKRLSAPGALFGRGRGATALYGKSTMDLVRGKDLKRGGARTYDAVGRGKGRSIDGVLTPEESRKREQGVALQNGELLNGLMSGAYAEEIMGGNFEEISHGAADGGGKMLSGARVDDPGAMLVKSRLSRAAVPRVGRSLPRSAKAGKLSARRFRGISAAVSGSLGSMRTGGRNTVMYQLAEGEAYSLAGAPPPGKCDPNDCPSEYAKNISAVPFDGAKPYGGILSSEEMGDPAVPRVPSQAEIDSMINEAEQLERDAIACERANETWGPQMDASSARLQGYADRLNAMGCDSSSCSRSKARRCKAVGDQMKSECGVQNTISQSWANDCPLTEGKFDSMNCSQ